MMRPSVVRVPSDYYHRPQTESFPLFVDSAPSTSPNYFSGSMAMIQLLSPPESTATWRKPPISVSTKVLSNLRLRYYQYEVTLGLYMMTPIERLIMNLIVLTGLIGIITGLVWGFRPFAVSTVCKLIYYITGSVDSVQELCSQS